MASRIYTWLDSRLKLGPLEKTLLDEPIPGGASWIYVFGSATLFLFVLQAVTGMFLAVSRVLPHVYPLEGELGEYIADEHALGRLLDLGVIVPRLTELYSWSATELDIPDLTDLVDEATPAYAWDPRDREPWAPTPRRFVRVVRRALPPPRRSAPA